MTVRADRVYLAPIPALDVRHMLRPRTTIDAADTRAKLDDLTAAVHREAEGAEADPFEDAMVTAVAGAAEALKAEVGALAELEARLGRLARKV